jgi:hypothetical protein
VFDDRSGEENICTLSINDNQKTYGKRSTAKHRFIQEDNIEFDFKKMGCLGVD